MDAKLVKTYTEKDGKKYVNFYLVFDSNIWVRVNNAFKNDFSLLNKLATLHQSNKEGDK